MQHSRPYKLKDDKPLCQKCIHNKVCEQVRNDEHECLWQETEIDAALKTRRRGDILTLIQTKEYAREVLEKIEDIVFCPEPYTGNAGTNYNLGMRRVIMNDLAFIMEVTGHEKYTDLIVYLKNTLTGGSTDGEE